MQSTGYVIFYNGLIIQWGTLGAIIDTNTTGTAVNMTITYPTSFIKIFPGDVFFHFEYSNPWETQNRIVVLGLHNYFECTMNTIKIYLVGFCIDNTLTTVTAGGNAHYFCIGF